MTPTHLCIAMEYCSGGELYDRVVVAGKFDDDTARIYFRQVVQGVAYCHANVRWLHWGRIQPAPQTTRQHHSRPLGPA